MLSTTTWIAILFGLIVIKYVFIQPTEDRKVYKLYEKRDKVAFAGIERKIDQESNLYKFLIDYLNFWIYYSKNDYDFSIVLKNFLKIEEVQKKHEKLEQEIKQNEIAGTILKQTQSNVKWVMGFKGFIFITIGVRTFILLLQVLLYIFDWTTDVFDKGHRIVKLINKSINKSRTIQNDYQRSKELYKRIHI